MASRERLGGPLVDLAVQVERTVVDVLAELKPGRHLYTNVEFYAGVVMDLCGIPRHMFTPTFAAGRTIGWSTHVMEQAAHNRLIRPAARYVGPPPPQEDSGPVTSRDSRRTKEDRQAGLPPGSRCRLRATTASPSAARPATGGTRQEPSGTSPATPGRDQRLARHDDPGRPRPDRLRSQAFTSRVSVSCHAHE